MGTMTFALERPRHFLSEKRTRVYEQYCLGVSQLKNALVAKNTLQWRALPDMERIGA